MVKENLRELDFGEWEGLKFGEINERYHDSYQNWLKDPYNNPPTGGKVYCRYRESVKGDRRNT